MSTSTTSATEERALTLLSSGVKQSVVAATLGVTESAISQLVSRDDFAARLSAARFEAAQRHTARDARYDKIEDDLLEKMETAIGMMYKPGEILRALQIVNQAKRRGTDPVDSDIAQGQIVQLTVPVQILNNITFNTNAQGQVTRIQDTDLTTIQSGSMDNLLKARKEGGSRNELANLTRETISTGCSPKGRTAEISSTTEAPRTGQNPAPGNPIN